MTVNDYYYHDESKPIAQRSGRDLDQMKPLLLTILPWFEFAVLSMLILFFYHKFPVLVWFSVMLFVVLDITYIGIGVWLQRRGGRFYVVLGVLSMFAVMFALLSGFYTYYEFMINYVEGEERRTYADVRPDEEAASHSDAGRLIFSEDAYLNTELALGYLQDRTTYCVVPIVGEPQVSAVQFWAVGEDCCNARKSFECDDASHKQVRTGVVLLNEANPFASDSLAPYKQAVEEACGAYKIQSAKEVIFVRWIADPDALQASYWTYSVGITLTLSLLYLLISVLVGNVLRPKL